MSDNYTSTVIASLSYAAKQNLHHSALAIMALCRPFFQHLDLMYFDYHRFYRNGEMVMMSSDALLAENYLLTDYKPLPQDMFQFLKSQLQWTFMSDLAPMPTGMHDFRARHESNINLLKCHDVLHRAYHVSLFPDHIRLCGFGTNRNIDSVMSFYLNKLHDFEQLIVYFEARAKLLIVQNKRCRLCVPSYQQGMRQLWQDLDLDKTPSTEQSLEHCGLSRSELICLKLQNIGLSAKEIADVVNLSHRMVEKHVANARVSLGLRAELSS